MKGPHCRWLKWIGAALLIAASLIRYPSFQLLIFASLPVLLFTLYHLFKSIHFKKYLLPGVVAVIGVLGCKIYDTQYYQQDQDWREFMEFHAAAADVSNYVLVPFEKETKPAFDSAGWTFIDYLMIRNFIYLDPVTYSSENLHKFSSQKKELNLRKYPPVMQARAIAFKDAFTDPVTVICFVAACFFAYLNKKGVWQRSVIKWLLMWSMLIMIGLIIYKKLPDRVYIPLSVLPFYFSLLLNLPELVSNMKKWNYNKALVVRSGVLLLFLAATFSVWKQVGRADRRLIHNAGFKSDLIKLKHMHPEKVFLACCTFPVGLFLPLENQSEYRGFKCLYLTGRQGSPLFQQNMKAYGIHSPYTELYETDRLLLISHPKMIPLLKLYFKQHYDVKLDFEKINAGIYFHVYQMSLPETKKSSKNDTAYSVNQK
ncbi:hypothetical protein [Gimesia sp.]|uniref:hypothetical protein n=1 Tax=Gimesia sp. TaxID=2024833 RepID=UPI003A8FEF30